MKPQEALQILINASGLARLTREEHMSVQVAIETLAKLVRPEEPKDKPNKEDKA